MKRPRRLWLTLFTLVALAILVSLGMWQVRRLEWKTDLIERIEAARSAPPVPLREGLLAAARGEPVEFRRVAFQCVEVGASALVQLQTTGRTEDGQLVPGYRYIYACPVQAGSYRSVLVDAGFDHRDRVNTCLMERGEPLPTLIGSLRRDGGRNAFTPPDEPARRLFHARDIPAMAAAIGAPSPAPYMVVLERSQCWARGRPTPLPSDVPNNHLGYAITWFGLAASLVGVYIAVLIGDRRRAAGEAC